MARSFRAAIAATTNLPIKFMVMSHVHPDHVFGASAFLADNPVFVGHARLKEALGQRGEYYRGKLTELLGPEATGTVVLPQMEIRNFAEIDLAIASSRQGRTDLRTRFAI
jgi:glyoxylase-like metal-dependent hydrolase (beta-lactamase superfamily II)